VCWIKTVLTPRNDNPGRCCYCAMSCCDNQPTITCMQSAAACRFERDVSASRDRSSAKRWTATFILCRVFGISRLVLRTPITRKGANPFLRQFLLGARPPSHALLKTFRGRCLYYEKSAKCRSRPIGVLAFVGRVVGL